MSADERNHLALQQAVLVRCLVASAPAPSGFAPSQLQATARSLLHKRRRTVARAWPALAASLGYSYREHFLAYAFQSPVPAEGGPLADGRAFARFLADRGELPEAGQHEALGVDLYFRSVTEGLRPRRWPCMCWSRLRSAGRLLIAARLPGFTPIFLALPLGWNAHVEQK